MRTLVIHAHPLEDSYSAALRDAVCDTLGLPGNPPELVRLCQGETVDPTMLGSVEHLVVVYPTWWGGLPAVLLAWVQRTLGPSIDGDAPSPLRTVRRLSVVTTHGSSKLVNTMQGEPGRQLWTRTIVDMCAPLARFEWISLYKIDQLDEPGRVAFIDQVRVELGAIPVA